MNQTSMIQRFIDAAERTGDISLRLWYQKQMFKEQLLSGQERQALVNEITENVLSRISVTVDTDDIIQKVRSVQQEIDRLTQ